MLGIPVARNFANSVQRRTIARAKLPLLVTKIIIFNFTSTNVRAVTHARTKRLDTRRRAGCWKKAARWWEKRPWTRSNFIRAHAVSNLALDGGLKCTNARACCYIYVISTRRELHHPQVKFHTHLQLRISRELFVLRSIKFILGGWDIFASIWLIKSGLEGTLILFNFHCLSWTDERSLDRSR